MFIAVPIKTSKVRRISAVYTIGKTLSNRVVYELFILLLSMKEKFKFRTSLKSGFLFSKLYEFLFTELTLPLAGK